MLPKLREKTGVIRWIGLSLYLLALLSPVSIVIMHFIKGVKFSKDHKNVISFTIKPDFAEVILVCIVFIYILGLMAIAVNFRDLWPYQVLLNISRISLMLLSLMTALKMVILVLFENLNISLNFKSFSLQEMAIGSLLVVYLVSF